MKKALGMAVIMLFVGSTTAMAQLANSGHDFSEVAWSGGTQTTTSSGVYTGGDVCAPCHTPHTTSNLSPEVPLWNHVGTSSGGYTMYTSPTMDATRPNNPDGASAACMGCHDGVVGLAQYGGNTTDNTVMTATGNFGTKTLMTKNLTKEHPISITYSEVSGQSVFNTGTSVNALLRGGKVQCNSCHDPHNQGFEASPTLTNTGGRSGYTWKFLRVDNTASAMCTTCHNL